MIPEQFGPFFIFLAVFSALFLFWRAGRHELFESDLLFDTIIIGAIGAFLGGRITDFLVRFSLYGFSIEKLVFFNVYGGFNFWGVLIGAGLATFLLLKVRRVNPWQIFDLAAAPLAFSQWVISGGQFLKEKITWPLVPSAFYAVLFYLGLFWTLKRLESQKRHLGFFVGFYLVGSASFGLLRYLLVGLPGNNLEQFRQIVLTLAILGGGSVLWYSKANRILVNDFKSGFAFSLLVLLRIRRMVTSTEEAGKFARSLLFLPVYLIRSLYLILKVVAMQFALGLFDFVKAIKGRR